MSYFDESHVTHDGGPPPEGGTHKGRREDCPGPSCGPVWYDDVPDTDLPGMREQADFTGGWTDDDTAELDPNGTLAQEVMTEMRGSDPFAPENNAEPRGPGRDWFVAGFDGTCERGRHVFTTEDSAAVRENEDGDWECQDCVMHDDVVNASVTGCPFRGCERGSCK